MARVLSSSSSKFRPNPFPFPSDTTLRFALLVIFVVAGSEIFFIDLWWALHDSESEAAGACVTKYVTGLLQYFQSALSSSSDSMSAIYKEGMRGSSSCSQLMRGSGFFALGGVLLTVLVSLAIYLILPAWRRKAQRYEDITLSDSPDLYRSLNDLCDRASLKRKPTFVWNPLSMQMPSVFGRIGRHYVALGGAFVARYFRGEKLEFTAIVSHELAHLENSDVDKTYLTIAAWAAFLVTNLLPAAIICAVAGLHRTAPLLFDVTLSTVVIVFSGLAVLRTREYYADVLVSAWDESPTPIDRALASLPAASDFGWRRYLRFHPSPAARQNVIRDPFHLFPASPWDAFGVGLAAWTILSATNDVHASFIPTTQTAYLASDAVAHVLAPAVVLLIAVGAVGIGVWRTAFMSLLTDRNPRAGCARLGIAFGLSYLAVQCIVLASALITPAPRAIPQAWHISYFALHCAIGLLLTLACIAIFAWIADAASAWLGVVLNQRSPHPVMLITAAVALFLLGCSLFAAFSLLSFPVIFRLDADDRFTLVVFALGPPTFLASIAACAFPLAGEIRSRRLMPEPVPAWAILDRDSQLFVTQDQLFLSRAAVTGICAGLVCCLYWEAMYFRSILPAGLGQHIFALYLWMHNATRALGPDVDLYLTFGVFQGAAATIAAAGPGRLGTVMGLLAALTSGIVITAGYMISHGIPDSPWSHVLQRILTPNYVGMMVALPAAIASAVLATLLRRFRDSSGRGREQVSNAESVREAGIDSDVANSDCRNVSQNPALSRKWRTFQNFAASTLALSVAVCWIVRAQDAYRNHLGVEGYRAAAQAGDSRAQEKVGDLYATRQSSAQRDAQAVFWWSKAAAQGSATAEFKLGTMYADGRGVAQNNEIAWQLFSDAAAKGNPVAEFLLGQMYLEGRWVNKDLGSSAFWLRRASAHGLDDAWIYLRTMCRHDIWQACD